jgi:hypothetical protein
LGGRALKSLLPIRLGQRTAHRGVQLFVEILIQIGLRAAKRQISTFEKIGDLALIG